MESRNSLKWLLLTFSIAGIIFVLSICVPKSFYTKFLPSIGNQSSKILINTESIKITQNISSGKQANLIDSKSIMQLTIPKIKVNASVISVGLTSNGAMDTTKGPDDVAWFKLGPRPWEKGSAVIAGHYGPRKNGKISVFHDLNQLIKWDKLYIENDNEVVVTFIVRESKIYYSNDDTSDVFTSNDDNSHLNLITCEGLWDKTSKTYSKRLVVFTDKEE